MTYQRYLHLFTTLLILTGFLAIYLTGGYTVPVLSGVAVTIGYWFAGERLAHMLRIPRFVWNAVAILLLTYLTFDSFYGALDLIGNGIQFVIYLQIVKLLSPKTNRDHMQIYVLSFLHIIASTVLSDDISFAIPFLVYIVLATWALALFNLKLQLEESCHPARREISTRSLLRSKNIITRRFLTATSLLSVSIISFTMVIFFLFPRLTWGQFFKRVGRRQHISGFSETVELGTIGNIKTNNTVMMRIEFPKEGGHEVDYEELYWRGTAADYFDGRVWSKNSSQRYRIRVDEDTGILSFTRTLFPGERLLRHRIFLEPLSTQLLFAADRFYRATWPKGMIDRIRQDSFVLYMDEYAGIHFASSSSAVSDLSYEAESIIGKVDPLLLRNSPQEYSWWHRKNFLQLPPLDPEVEELIQNIPIPEGGSAYDRAIAIQNFLEDNYSYTLDVQDIGVRDPLRFFFLRKKQGHCEYFSTALTIALRVHGIPAQQVMGFRGGEFNPYGDYLAVRQADAHTWVEAYFPKIGWIRFDPSPLDVTAGRRPSRFQVFYQIVDYLRLRWNKYIIEYDLRTQANALERLGKKIADKLKHSRGKEDEKRFERDVEEWRWSPSWLLRQYGVSLFVLLLLGTAIFFALRRRRQRAVGLFDNVFTILKRRGYERELHQTITELVEEVEKKEGEIEPLRRLNEMYYDHRFGGKGLAQNRWHHALRRLRSTFSTRRKNDLSKRTDKPTRRAA